MTSSIEWVSISAVRCWPAYMNIQFRCHLLDILMCKPCTQNIFGKVVRLSKLSAGHWSRTLNRPLLDMIINTLFASHVALSYWFIIYGNYEHFLHCHVHYSFISYLELSTKMFAVHKKEEETKREKEKGRSTWRLLEVFLLFFFTSKEQTLRQTKGSKKK